MQITETSAEGLKREFKVVISAKDIESKVDSKLDEVGRTVKIPGFRPGKVPRRMLKQRFGKSVMGEVLEQAVSESVSKAIEDKGVRPALQPKVEIDTFEDGSDLEYTLSMEILPDIEPMDFSALKLERFKVAATDEEVGETLERLTAQHRDTKPVAKARKSKAGDVLVADFEGTVDGTPFPGGSAEDQHIELGAQRMIPGFEDQLLGAAPGDRVEVKVTFPADYANRELAGRDAVFDVRVKELREPVPVALDDALAKQFGQNSVEDLRAAVRGQIEQDYDALSRSRLKRDLLDILAESHDFSVPEGMVDAEFDIIWKQVEEQRGKGDLDEEDKAKSEDELKAEFRAIAERRVRLGLLLSEVGRANNITVSQEDMNRAIVQQAQRVPGHEREFIDRIQKDENALANLRAPIFEDKVIDFMLELAKVSDKPATIEELLADPDDGAAPKKAGRKKSAGAKAAKSGKLAKSGGAAKTGRKADAKTAAAKT